MGTTITLPSNKGDTAAYLARPAQDIRGGVIVIHEVWGLVDHTKDVADRFAREGYIALAPDLLSDTIDVTAAGMLQEDLFNPEKRNEAQPRLREITSPVYSPTFGADTIVKLRSCFDYLYNLPETHQSIGVVGFCFGGSYSFSLATEESRLKIAIPFYGHADQDIDVLKKVCCPIRAFYGENDERLISGLSELRQKMQAAGVDFEAKTYPNCGHAFFNDTNKFAYNKTAATDAWKRVIAYSRQYIG